MDNGVLRRMIEQLRGELVEIHKAIGALETLATGKRRRGRPPKILRNGPVRPGKTPPKSETSVPSRRRPVP